MPSEDRNVVVDLVMQTTMAEVDLSLDGLDCLLITLRCRHTFTVETLDGICGVEDYYERDASGEKWISLKNSPSGITSHPTCPTCRSDITSRRYGRIIKRAKLDLLEHNLASKLARALFTVQKNLERIDKASAKAGIEAAAAQYQQPIPMKKVSPSHVQLKRLDAIMTQKERHPTSIQSLEELAAIDSSPAQWRDTVRILFKSYKEVTEVAITRSAHGAAYEAAFTRLYHDELDGDYGNNARRPEQHALTMARIRIGQPRPLADKRYHVEAFWTAVQIRFTLAELATLWFSALPEKARTMANRWAVFVMFLYESALHDALAALATAMETSSHRQVVQTSVLIERAKFELFRFNYSESSKTGMKSDSCELFKLQVNDRIAQFRTVVSSVCAEHKQKMPMDTAWLSSELDEPMNTLAEAWASLRLSVHGGTFYQTVSLEERMSIVASFKHEFGFGKCPGAPV
jgi:hypothetical protein